MKQVHSNNAYLLLLRAYRLLKKRKAPIIASDLGKQAGARRALEVLVVLGIAEKVPMIYYTGRYRTVCKSVQGYILNKDLRKKKK